MGNLGMKLYSVSEDWGDEIWDRGAPKEPGWGKVFLEKYGEEGRKGIPGRGKRKAQGKGRGRDSCYFLTVGGAVAIED